MNALRYGFSMLAMASRRTLRRLDCRRSGAGFVDTAKYQDIFKKEPGQLVGAKTGSLRCASHRR